MEQHKYIYLVRHAKSSWDNPGRADIDRPLSDRGVKNAYKMVNKMRERGESVDHIFTSPANRAIHTALIFARELNYPVYQIEITEGVYFNGFESIIEAVTTADNSRQSLMIFGHNPDITIAAGSLSGRETGDIPTCGLVRMVFDVSSWEDIHRGKLVDYFYDFPKKR